VSVRCSERARGAFQRAVQSVGEYLVKVKSMLAKPLLWGQSASLLSSRGQLRTTLMNIKELRSSWTRETEQTICGQPREFLVSGFELQP
jgi:hypothetical protein